MVLLLQHDNTELCNIRFQKQIRYSIPKSLIYNVHQEYVPQ